jgi:diguanylate cyclase (GGDEF)-like protein/PAS domain S-box-containing protein
MDGRWLQANGALCRLTGYSLEEILKVGFHDITHPDDRAADEEQIGRLRNGEIDSYRLEKRFIHARGFPVWVSFNSSLVRLAGGPPLYLISQVEDISQRKELERQLRHLAQHDPLTGLFNRRRFDEELTRQLAHARRYQTSGALFILDLDNFKQVNDAHGHAAGDQVLNGVATILRTQLRATDVPARLGGDEFAVLLDDADLEGAKRVATKLLNAVRGNTTTPGAIAPIRLSVGIALLGPGGPSQEALMQQADHAMYRSKQQGGDRCCVYSEIESDSSKSLLELSRPRA